MKQKTKRRSYKNAIAIGIASFSSIALLSTGLASFVIIRNAQQTAGGNIVVAEVSDTAIVLALTEGATGDITLDAENGDYSGRVQVEQGGEGAKLSHTVEGTVKVGISKTIAANVELTYVVNIKKDVDGTMVVANSEFITKYIDSNKLSLDGFVLGSTTNTITPTLPDPAKKNEGVFTMNFGFEWGTAYGSKNPSVYYDEDPVGMTISDNDVKTELELLASATKYTFEIVIFAKNK